MHYKIKELHKLITYLVNEEGISDYAEKMLEGYAFSLETVIKVGIENNFPPSNMTEKERNKGRE